MTRKTPYKPDPARVEIYKQIAVVLTDRPGLSCFEALCDHLALSAGFLSDDKEQAEKMLEAALPNLIRILNKNWPVIEEIRKNHSNILN